MRVVKNTRMRSERIARKKERTAHLYLVNLHFSVKKIDGKKFVSSRLRFAFPQISVQRSTHAWETPRKGKQITRRVIYRY